MLAFSNVCLVCARERDVLSHSFSEIEDPSASQCRPKPSIVKSLPSSIASELPLPFFSVSRWPPSAKVSSASRQPARHEIIHSRIEAGPLIFVNSRATMHTTSVFMITATPFLTCGLVLFDRGYLLECQTHIVCKVPILLNLELEVTFGKIIFSYELDTVGRAALSKSSRLAKEN